MIILPRSQLKELLNPHSKRGFRNEKNHNKRTGLTSTRGSGRGKQKADGFDAHFLEEHKDTRSKQYALKFAELQKVEQQAIDVNKTPVFSITFGEQVYYVLREVDFVLFKQVMTEEEE